MFARASTRSNMLLWTPPSLPSPSILDLMVGGFSFNSLHPPAHIRIDTIDKGEVVDLNSVTLAITTTRYILLDQRAPKGPSMDSLLGHADISFMNTNSWSVPHAARSATSSCGRMVTRALELSLTLRTPYPNLIQRISNTMMTGRRYLKAIYH